MACDSCGAKRGHLGGCPAVSGGGGGKGRKKKDEDKDGCTHRWVGRGNDPTIHPFHICMAPVKNHSGRHLCLCGERD